MANYKWNSWCRGRGDNKEKGEKDPEDMRSECSADYEGYDGDGSRVIAESR